MFKCPLQTLAFSMQGFSENSVHSISASALYSWFMQAQHTVCEYEVSFVVWKLWIIFISSFQNFLNGLWGKLASEILTQNWENALEDLNRLKEFIESNLTTSPLQALQQRTWLIHWSLFVFFNHSKGEFIDAEERPKEKYINRKFCVKSKC